MPREIFDEEKFLELSEFAVHCRIKRHRDVVKLKLITIKILYTFKKDQVTVERLIINISYDIIEL